METKARATTRSSLEGEGTPLSGILCLKTKQDMKRFKETEDCFILELREEMETKARATTRSSLEGEGTPLSGILCLKTKQDMKRFEETEDCFILDFDPFDSFDMKSLSLSGDKDLAIIHEKGQVACRDYPHPRHLCLNFPFGSTPNATHCDLCYCYVCDKPAPCAQWTSLHCNASADSVGWKLPSPENESSYYYSD